MFFLFSGFEDEHPVIAIIRMKNDGIGNTFFI